MINLAFLGIFQNPRTPPLGARHQTQDLTHALQAFTSELYPLPYNLYFSRKRSLTARTVCLVLQEPKNKETTTEEELVREVDRLKAKVEAGRACYLEKYKECQRLHKQIRQLRASAMVGASERAQESKGHESQVLTSPEDTHPY